MKVDVSSTLVDRDGEVIIFNKKALTVSRAICAALDSGTEGKVSLEDKVKRFKIACRIQDATLPVELTIEEAALIQKAVNEFFSSPLVVAPIYLALEKAGAAEKEEKGVKNGRASKSLDDGARAI